MRREGEFKIEQVGLPHLPPIARTDQRPETHHGTAHARLGEHRWSTADLTEPMASAIIRRAIDISVALALLVLTLPIMIAIAVCIRLDSPGPAVFCQKRVGRAGKLFTFYKFRTMYANARQLFPELYRYEFTAEELEALYFKRRDDPRVTRAGRWLRRRSLDELPNLISLLLGDVTLVGPRPDIPEMVRHYTPRQSRKLHVNPGITGLAQIHGRCQLRFQETLRYDVQYVDRRSLKLDVEILLRTALAVLTGHGAF